MDRFSASDPIGVNSPSDGCGVPNRNGGFTLVEVVTVAAIIAVLSAVAIPVYTGMVKSQRKEVAKNICQSTAVSANIYFRRYGAGPVCATTADCVALLGIFLTDSAKYSLSITSDSVLVRDVTLDPADAVSASYR
jgi:prepilin-type N-terminal cleavage/methylation domain-containing protein